MTREEVFNLLRNIDPSKSSGPDNVPGRLLKEGAEWLAEPLSNLLSLSLSKGALPRDWTSANVSPVHKKGNKHSVSNYRPVSLTCIAVKPLERIVYNHIYDYLTTNGKLNRFQHGFRKDHSCLTQLLETVHLWAKSIDLASSSHVAFLDFSNCPTPAPAP